MPRFTSGTTVIVCPPHEECAGWRAILAGFKPDGNAVVIPIEGHFGRLNPRTIDLSHGANGPGIALSMGAKAILARIADGQQTFGVRIDADVDAAVSLATSLAEIFDLTPKN